MVRTAWMRQTVFDRDERHKPRFFDRQRAVALNEPESASTDIL